VSDNDKIPFERVISVYNRAGQLLTEDRQCLVKIYLPKGGLREEPSPAAAASEPPDPFKAYPVPFLGQTSPDPPPGFRRAKRTPPATLADLEAQLIGTDAEKAPFLAVAAEMMGLPDPLAAGTPWTPGMPPAVGGVAPIPMAPIPYGVSSHLDACGLSANDVAVVTGLLLTVFNDDHAAAKKWLGERCGPLWGKPIDVLKEGGVERVLAFLRQAAP
jgi:hypothetical protein